VIYAAINITAFTTLKTVTFSKREDRH